MMDATPPALKLACCVGLGLTWLQNVRLREVIEVGCVVDAFDLNRDRGRPFSATSTREGEHGQFTVTHSQEKVLQTLHTAPT